MTEERTERIFNDEFAQAEAFLAMSQTSLQLAKRINCIDSINLAKGCIHYWKGRVESIKELAHALGIELKKENNND